MINFNIFFAKHVMLLSQISIFAFFKVDLRVSQFKKTHKKNKQIIKKEQTPTGSRVPLQSQAQ